MYKREDHKIDLTMGFKQDDVSYLEPNDPE